MASAGILLALMTLAPGQGPKELVALPLSEEGVKPPAGLDAWKVVTQELKRAGRLGMSMALQKKQHDFLIGPAREQAIDCGSNVECLAEIGAALKADVLIAGIVDATSVSLIAIDVKGSKRIATGRSSKRLSKSNVKKRAYSATRSLIEAFGKASSQPGVAAKAPDAAPDQQKKTAEPPPPESPPAIASAPPPEDASRRTGALEGELHIAQDQLSGVSEVKVDGETLLFSGDGSMRWKGAPGTHSLVAIRSDGSRITKDVTIEPDKTIEVALEPPPAAITAVEPKKQGEREEKNDDVLTKWWFWTSIGAAVAAGATTAALLAGGAKGGPDLEGDTGTIRGRY